MIVTAYGREEVFHEAEGAGLEGVLVKPVSPSLLFDTTIRALVGDGAGRRRRGGGAAAAPRADATSAACAARACCSSRTTSSTSRSPLELLGAADVAVDVADERRGGASGACRRAATASC